MAKRKKQFDLEMANGKDSKSKIVIANLNYKPTVWACFFMYNSYHKRVLNPKEAERFAVNILKALKSKHLKP